jgi:hypothetical protein
MKRLVLFVLAVLLCIAPANTQTIPKSTLVLINVDNHSDTCALVTIYWGQLNTPWTIASSPEGRPRFVNYHSWHRFAVHFTNPTGMPVSAEIKVRAEYTRNQDCTGGTIEDDNAYNQRINENRLERIEIWSTLSGPPYWVSVPR